MKTKILVAALAAGMVASPAMADGHKNAVSITGQVSNIVGIGGDFDESLNIAQNNSSGSRFRFKAEKEWGGIKVGLRHEIQNRKGPAGNGGAGPEDSNIASGQDDLRYSDIFFSGGFGKISVGQGDGAANGIAESYTNVGGNYFGGLDSYWFGTTSLQTGANLGFAQFDFLSRNQRIRYDSPKFGGLQISGSVRSRDGEELALRYKGKAGGWAWTANAGFSSAGDVDRQVITAGILMPFGLNIAGRVGEQDTNGATRDTSLISVGYRVGKLRANVEVGTSDNANGTETDGTVFGVTYAGPVLIYAQIGKFERDNPDGTTDEFSAPVVGFRMKF